jgi:KinB signaling pathway activation protein
LNLRNWIYLFWTTLLAGAVSAMLAGMYLQFTDQEFHVPGASGVGFNLMMMAMGGLMFSIISQMGFFAYLTVNYIAMGIIRKKYWWNMLQLLIIMVVLFDAAYLRYIHFGENNTLLSYMGLPVLMLVAALIIAYWKVRMTNRSAWIPTIFFISVGTIVEAVPGLQQNNTASTVFMTVPLLACNAWQILMLHKLVGRRKAEE